MSNATRHIPEYAADLERRRRLCGWTRSRNSVHRDLSEAESPAIVGPRRSPLLLALLLALSACRGETDLPSGTARVTQASWSEQLAEVREGRSSEIVISQETISAAQIEQLAEGCDGLTILEIESADFFDETLAVVDQCPHLKRLKLGMPMADAGVEHIAAATGLEFVNLPTARFTDDGLAALARLPRLELLRFHSPHVTDAGIAHIAEIDSLRFLHLIDVPITDEGLIPLHAMTGLESFYLDGSQCSDDGLRDLLNALPELHFHKDQLHLPDDPNTDAH